MRRLAVLSTDPSGPSTRHRWRALTGILAEAGFDLDIVPLPKEAGARAAAFERAGAAEVVVLQRRLLRSADRARLRRAAHRLVYDFDDAMPHRDPFRGPARSTTRAHRFLETCRAVDAVIAGTEALADLARPAEPRAVFVAPTPVAVERYGPAPSGGDGTVMGWIGSRSTRPYLDAIAGPLAEAARAVPGLRLRVVADAAPRLAGVEVEFVPWSEDGEAAALRGMDVGLMPLSDDPWSRGKCGFKLLQYMATGLPSIASPVGVNARIVVEGRTGRLATTPGEWTTALVDLAGDAEARRRMGAAARAQAERRWSPAVLGPPLAAFLARVAGAAPTEAR